MVGFCQVTLSTYIYFFIQRIPKLRVKDELVKSNHLINY